MEKCRIAHDPNELESPKEEWKGLQYFVDQYNRVADENSGCHYISDEWTFKLQQDYLDDPDSLTVRDFAEAIFISEQRMDTLHPKYRESKGLIKNDFED